MILTVRISNFHSFINCVNIIKYFSHKYMGCVCWGVLENPELKHELELIQPLIN